MIEKRLFGRTGHQSTVTLFGAAALGSMRQERADRHEAGLAAQQQPGHPLATQRKHQRIDARRPKETAVDQRLIADPYGEEGADGEEVDRLELRHFASLPMPDMLPAGRGGGKGDPA